MRYKVGQKVLVRKDLCYEGDYYMEGGVHRNGVVSSMISLKGQVATILTVFSDGSGYTLKEDRGGWTWTDEMLELSNEITLTQMNKKKQEEKEGGRTALNDYLLFDIESISDGFSQMPRFTIPREVPRFSIPQSSRDHIARWFER